MKLPSIEITRPFPHTAVRSLFCLAAAVAVAITGCEKHSTSRLAIVPQSSVHVTPGQSKLTVRTSAATFSVSQNGYVTAQLSRAGRQLSLDDPSRTPGIDVRENEKEFSDFDFDVAHARVSAPGGNLGSQGKHIEIDGTSPRAGLQATLTLEAYDEFPQVALTSVVLKNAGSADLSLEDVALDQHRLSASLADTSARPYQMWSFHGASIRWGKDDVFEIPEKFSQQNQMGSLVEVGDDLGRVGGGIPVVAFWTRTVGEAIGHIETLPLVLSVPVETDSDDHVRASVHLAPGTTLKPGASYSTPRTFIAVFSGDYYEPLRMYSDLIAREGLPKVKETGEDYAVSWCGWGYLADVTPAQMVATIPKLKELGIHWATLDDRWFNNYGDWQPRTDTFPGDSLQKMVREFHSQGMKMQLWWLPLAVEDGGGGYESHKYGVSEVVKEHPDWLVLDKNGKPARMTRNLATLCPALPEVQAYYKQLTERIIHDWDFDGHKLDNIYSVPACYNPKHHHKSPQDSIYAMGEIYKTIFQTTRALKTESVTQSCPCGTPPSIAWLRDLDQAVTADPVGSVQVRRRIKMYKALLGADAAVYGDHVELTHIKDVDTNERDLGRDFASTFGTGGVLGTKFTWPDDSPKYRDVYLTPKKDAHWRKWIGLYNQKMLSRGTFMNLYVYGYDVPEGYAIAKDGAMYYAFFAPQANSAQEGGQNAPGGDAWSGEIELRGLAPGKYHVVDYVNDRDLGTVTAPNARLKASFTDHLLLQVTPE